MLNPSIDLTVYSNPLDLRSAQHVQDGIPILLEKLQPTLGAYAPKCNLLEDVSTVPAGKPLQCTLQAVDFKGRPRKTGGDYFEASLDSNESFRTDAFVKPSKDTPGVYFLFFNAPKPGNYTLSLTMEGRHISGSPFKVTAQ